MRQTLKGVSLILMYGWKPMLKPTGEMYWAYMLCYVDDKIIISHNLQEVMDFISSRYTLKEGNVKEPNMYLSMEVKKWNIDNS